MPFFSHFFTLTPPPKSPQNKQKPQHTDTPPPALMLLYTPSRFRFEYIPKKKSHHGPLKIIFAGRHGITVQHKGGMFSQLESVRDRYYVPPNERPTDRPQFVVLFRENLLISDSE